MRRGTPGYQPPESAAEPIDGRRCDEYALLALGHDMLTGQSVHSVLMAQYEALPEETQDQITAACEEASVQNPSDIASRLSVALYKHLIPGITEVRSLPKCPDM